MLRRRMFLNTIVGGYYWAISTVKLLMERKATPITAPAEEAETGRCVVNKRSADAGARSIVVGFTDRYASASRSSNPEAADAVEASRFSKILTSRKGNAYSIPEINASSFRLLVMRRWANTMSVLADIAKSYRKVYNGSFGRGTPSDAVEANSERYVGNGLRAASIAADCTDVSYIKAFLVGRTAKPIAASISGSSVDAVNQNGTYAKAYSWIYPYHEDDMLVIRQAHSIMPKDNRLEVR